jgi:hypothetical protein
MSEVHKSTTSPSAVPVESCERQSAWKTNVISGLNKDEHIANICLALFLAKNAVCTVAGNAEKSHPAFHISLQVVYSLFLINRG